MFPYNEYWNTDKQYNIWTLMLFDGNDFHITKHITIHKPTTETDDEESNNQG